MMVNLFDLLVRLFCDHKRETLIHTYYADDHDEFTMIETFQCRDCKKIRVVSSGVLTNRKLREEGTRKKKAKGMN